MRIRDLIREARGERNQATFGDLLGKSQGVISKYEHGTVNPPASVVEECMNILQLNFTNEVSSELLATRIRLELGTPQTASMRKVIASLLDDLK